MLRPSQHLRSLDLLRGLAILLVLGCHMPPVIQASAAGVGASLLLAWQHCGWIGVDLFFVLSGFLISGLLFQEVQRYGGIAYGRFLLRRGFKIYPSFYFLLAAVVLFPMARGAPFVGWRVVLSECFFVQNYGPALFPQTWSLAVEEHFYLLLPLFLLLIRTEAKDPFKGLPAKFLIVTLLLTAARILNAELRPVFHYKTHLFPTHLRIDSLFFGVLLGYFYQWHKEKLFRTVARHRFLLGLLVCAAPVPAIFLRFDSAPFLSTLNPNLLYLGFGALLLLGLHYRLKFGSIEWIGRQSYTIYLWHIPVRFFGLGWLPANTSPAVHLLLYFGLSILVGAVAAKLIELPCLALRNRLFPSRVEPRGPVPLNPVPAEATAQAFSALSPDFKG